ncbi:hypothetical protein SISNIDRAFT_407139 [Sistotremastrum niveocremeum HHB9708]|uniref:Uncharacterized protein n=1 Tax=Sistotremastrum niveocremeum HHB9708 TaxID=1314777 RepID=A0A164XVH3_9AGAM|nr:hypothetical protein SISNIDRAFT_407139 [Sistotremastrum niveocremeum HHB9708]
MSQSTQTGHHLIQLYDIPSTFPRKAWSLNTWRARFALGFKGLRHKTVWVEYPDISPKMQSIGASPTSKKRDGSSMYTVPVIADFHVEGDGPTVVSDSWKIALYLDKTYPDTPTLLPPGTKGLQKSYIDWVEDYIFDPLFPVLLRNTTYGLNPPSAEFYRRTREAWLGKTLEEYMPIGPKSEEALDKVKKNLTKLAAFLDQNATEENEQPMFIMGDQLSYGDLVLAGIFMWFKISSEEHIWNRIKDCNDGRWARLLQTIDDKYGEVD